jgi:hypothetical protein
VGLRSADYEGACGAVPILRYAAAARGDPLVRTWTQRVGINTVQLSSHRCGTLQRFDNDW